MADPMTTDNHDQALEARARELLAETQRKLGRAEDADAILAFGVGVYGAVDTANAIHAIVAALREARVPDGFVLVPVEPTGVMLEASGKVVFREAGQQWDHAGGYAEDLVIETQRQCYAAILAAAKDGR